MGHRPRALLVATLALVAVGSAALGGRQFPLSVPTPNPSGLAQTLVNGRTVDRDEPFFENLGTNGRTCVTCHMPNQGWSIEPSEVRRRFETTQGRHPLFRLVDGAVSPYADDSTVAARREAYALLLSRGVFRVGLPIPAGAEFELLDVDDPHGFASSTELSLFRRPLPSTNLGFLTTVMWDGRESQVGRMIHDDLMLQANDATVGHAEAPPIDEATRRRIADFELRLTTAQTHDGPAGRLTADGATGGPEALAAQPFWFGINSRLDPSSLSDNVFTVFGAWLTAVGGRGAAQQAIARGETLFNSLMLPAPNNTRHACAGCHNTPNVGSNSTASFFDVGIANVSDLRPRSAGMPLYTLRCLSGPSAGETIQTTDPGRALITGKWSDVGRFKVPVLRGLAARAPYFHDGSAATLEDVVDHYDVRFSLGLLDQEKADLVAFLKAL
jgi:cytochrome c peroxidase